MGQRTNKKMAIDIRPGRPQDIKALLEIENRCFDYDRMGQRSFQWMLTRAHALLLVLDVAGELAGYGLVLINSGTSLARLYSIAVLPEFQGKGLSRMLLSELEARASEAECGYLRLEVKHNNHAAIKLYESQGYANFARKEKYYDDGTTALCYEKRIKFFSGKNRRDIPYRLQMTEFSCGPACLIMAMQALRPKFKVDEALELQLWREATTIFMSSGHGGCGPRGLALAAHRRGFRAELFLTHDGPMFTESVRDPKKKRVIELVHSDFDKQIKQSKLKVWQKKFGVKELRHVLNQGGIPIVLVSTYHFDQYKAAHWVVITAVDEHFVYFHDPINDAGDTRGVADKMHIPIHLDHFEKITRWGKSRVRAAVVLF